MVLHQNKSSKNYIYGESKQTAIILKHCEIVKILKHCEIVILSTELVMILAGILPFHFDLFGQISTHNIEPYFPDFQTVLLSFFLDVAKIK